jgi:hypothetical protein
MVLESALGNVVRKHRRHLQIIKPALDMLLQQIEKVEWWLEMLYM